MFTELKASLDGGKPKDRGYPSYLDDLYQLFVNLQKVFLTLKVEDSIEFINEGETFIRRAKSFILNMKMD